MTVTRVQRLGAASALALIVAGACGRDDRKGAFIPVEAGTAVPAYAALTLGGDTVHVGGPGPVTILNVWATWCESCREEMAGLDSLKEEYAARGVRVIAVSVDHGGVEKVRRFAEANQLGMTVAYDPAERVNALFGVVGVPTTFIIGPDGVLAWRHTGNVVSVMSEARAAIDRVVRPQP